MPGNDLASSFTRALGTLARAAHLDIEERELERAREACAVRGSAEAAWASDLARVGGAIGLQVTPLELSVRELLSGEADALMPLVRLERREEEVVCVTIVGRTRRRLHVTLGDDPSLLSLDEKALTALHHVPRDARLVWTTADLRASLGPHGPADHHLPPLRRLLALARLERDDLGVIVVYAAAVGLLSLATPLGVQFLVNTVAFSALLQPLVVVTLLVLLGLALEGLLSALKYWVIERVQQRIFVRVALDVAFRLPRVRQEVLDEHHGPELVNRFFEVVTLQKGAATLLSDGVSIALHALIGMLILAFYHPFLLAFDVALLLGIVLIVFVLGRGATPTAIRESEAKYAVAAWLEEAARHRSSLALGHGPAYVAARAESLTREWLHRRRKHWRVVFRQLSSALVLQAIASAALLGVGGWLVISRQLTLGQLVAAELIVTTVVAGFAKLGKSFESFYDLVASADKLGHLVDLELVRGDGAELPPGERGLDVVAKRLDLTCGATVLARGLDLHLSAGSRTVIHARGGAGKSVLADVLTGVRGPTAGQVLVDDVPTTDLSGAALGSVVAVVRNAEVFAGTIFENVAMGRPEVDRKGARVALEAVGLEDFVLGLPQGLDTPLPSDVRVIGDTAALLITVARALAGSPRLLVLDGALDGLADAARRVVWRATTARPTTVLLTTSRRELLDLAEASYSLEEQRLEKTTRGALRVSRAPAPLTAAEEA